MKKTLNELSADLMAVIGQIEYYAHEGLDVPEELMDALVASESDVADKLYGYKMYIEDNKARIANIKKEAKRVAEKAKTLDYMNRKLTGIMFDSVAAFANTNTKSGNPVLATDTYRMCAMVTESVEVVSVEDVPEAHATYDLAVKNLTAAELEKIREFMDSQNFKAVETKKVNKASVKAAFDAGEDVPGCRIIETKSIRFS